jgi:hypothetical protein
MKQWTLQCKLQSLQGFMMSSNDVDSDFLGDFLGDGETIAGDFLLMMLMIFLVMVQQPVMLGMQHRLVDQLCQQIKLYYQDWICSWRVLGMALVCGKRLF